MLGILYWDILLPIETGLITLFPLLPVKGLHLLPYPKKLIAIKRQWWIPEMDACGPLVCPSLVCPDLKISCLEIKAPGAQKSRSWSNTLEQEEITMK